MHLARNAFRCTVASCLVMLLTGIPAGAAEKDMEFEYPELQVTPLASERIALEAKQEEDGIWTRHLPIQLSALATTVAGIRIMTSEPISNAVGESKETRGLPAVLVGVGWLATSFYLRSSYRPYQSASDELKELKGGTRREQLVRERMAEERLASIARKGRILSWLSFVTNFGAAGFAMSATESSLGTAFCASAGVLSFLPLVFPYEWGRIADRQEEYKKRIYGPVASVGFLAEPRTGTPSPGLSLSLVF